MGEVQSTERCSRNSRLTPSLDLEGRLRGYAAAVGIVLCFVGAIITNIRAGAYSSIAFPLLHMVPVIVAVGLGAAA
ncbi:DoxX family protein [Nocardia sp. NPDC057440]|uniref:DoxX family protein n=1 Tax=Nocardia sp. NPDC057440 TaxID=3346134 RepID=UPI00366ACFE8